MDNPVTFAIGCFALFFCATLSSAGGVGGGGLNVPILISIFGYDYDSAVIISLFGVMGNVLVKVISKRCNYGRLFHCIICHVLVNWSRRHPAKPNRPLIYWDMILIMEPAQLGGSNLGVILAKVFPSSILEIVGLFVLSIVFNCCI